MSANLAPFCSPGLQRAKDGPARKPVPLIKKIFESLTFPPQKIF